LIGWANYLQGDDYKLTAKYYLERCHEVSVVVMYSRSGVGNFFARGQSSKFSQNEGSRDCTHNKLYSNKVICCQTYAMLIRITMTAFTHLRY